MPKGYDFHRMVLKVAPYHLTISPLDVDYLELTFGFDLECGVSLIEVDRGAEVPDVRHGGAGRVLGERAICDKDVRALGEEPATAAHDGREDRQLRLLQNARVRQKVWYREPPSDSRVLT